MSKNILNSPNDNNARKSLPIVHRSFSEGGSPFHFLLFPFSFLLMFSCTTQKQLTYLQDIDTAGKDNFFPYSRPEYRLQKQDILYVNIVTLNEEVNKMLNTGSSSGTMQTNQMQGGGAYLMGNIIRDSGFIRLPLIGNVYVFQKTMEEATKLIEEKASLLLKDARVIVKLLSYKITVLGEVRSPGNFTNYGNQLTVLDAIGMAGDLTDLGDRSRVLVVRPINEGSKTFRINLKDKNLLVSEAYFLLPNDIVIVEPRKVKLLSLNAQTISLFFSTVFSTISLTLLILNLNK